MSSLFCMRNPVWYVKPSLDKTCERRFSCEDYDQLPEDRTWPLMCFSTPARAKAGPCTATPAVSPSLRASPCLPPAVRPTLQSTSVPPPWPDALTFGRQLYTDFAHARMAIERAGRNVPHFAPSLWGFPGSCRGYSRIKRLLWQDGALRASEE